ncbi:hypothetical protein [Paraburkholderia sabiae]|uniref:hypothetical protein n=1 Tax=Paraburkholderia sabiae TaxID=273251 RepID=UPI001CC721CA|nr:hypothetical protein [Paraburkholderia sabiae]
MISPIMVCPLENGAVGIGFVVHKTMVVVIPSAVPDLTKSVFEGVSTKRVSLEKIDDGCHDSRWALKIFGQTFLLDECDVVALKRELAKIFTHLQTH